MMTCEPLMSRAVYTYSIPFDPYMETGVTVAPVDDRGQAAWVDVVLALRRLYSLRDNWDGLGAIAPPRDLVRSAVELAEAISRRNAIPPTTAVATALGTILFGWDGPDYLEIEVVAPYQAEWMVIDQDGKATHGEFPSE
jgi:hypothetical protein